MEGSGLQAAAAGLNKYGMQAVPALVPASSFWLLPRPCPRKATHTLVKTKSDFYYFHRPHHLIIKKIKIKIEQKKKVDIKWNR